MSNCKSIIIVLIYGLTLLSACESERERERGIQAKTVVAPDGSIRLTPEQIKASGIESAPVVEQEVTVSITAIGRVRARVGGEAQVYSPFAGRLIADQSRLPHIGGYVKQGVVIAEVEQMLTAAERAQLAGAAAQFGGNAAQFSATAAQLQAAMDQAQHDVAFEQVELDRAKKLYESGIIALQQYQTAELSLKQAQSKLDGAKRAKSDYDAARTQYEAAQKQQANAPTRAPIRAPISGTIVAADLATGQQLDPAKSLLTIVDLSRVWIEVAIHESLLSRARHAARVTFTTLADPERSYSGELGTIAGVIDPANRQATVIFAVDNPDVSLKIGMTAEARIPTGEKAKALLVPASAALADEGQSFVYVETEAGVFRRRAVTTGAREGDRIAIASGLKAGEKVVTVGAQSLRSETFRGQLSAEPEGEKK